MVVTPFVAPAEAQPVGESRSAWPGGDVTGTVTTADGTPVEGATVHATSRTDPRPFEDHRDTPGVLE